MTFILAMVTHQCEQILQILRMVLSFLLVHAFVILQVVFVFVCLGSILITFHLTVNFCCKCAIFVIQISIFKLYVISRHSRSQREMGKHWMQSLEATKFWLL